MADDDLLKGIVAVGLGILGGLAAVEILNRLSKKQCPICKEYNNSNNEFCDRCGGYLK